MKLFHYTLMELAGREEFWGMAAAIADAAGFRCPQFTVVHSPEPRTGWKKISVYHYIGTMRSRGKAAVYYRNTQQLYILDTFFPQDYAEIF